MDLAVNPPVKPMLAKAVAAMPNRDDLLFEPKWDGFRCLVFKDGDEIVLGSRNEKPLTRYFPELIEPIKSSLPKKCVVDGEIIVGLDDHLAFDALQQRIHPAESRVNLLAEQTPAMFVAFDLLCLGNKDLRGLAFKDRRKQLEKALPKSVAPIFLTSTTSDKETAFGWFKKFEGAGLDGLILKPTDEPYAENKRSQLKLKHVRTADAVVAGYRIHKDGKGVGSLLLGLRDSDGELRHVGVAASFTAKRRTELLDELAPVVETDPSNHPWARWAEFDTSSDKEPSSTSLPGAPNRWSASRAKKSASNNSWIPLRVELVAEVKYSTTINGRFRDVTKMLRWRPDKDPEQCEFDQLEQPEEASLSEVLTAE